MAYPTNNLALVLDDIDRQMVEMKSRVQQVRTASLGGLQSSQILNLFVELRQYRTNISVIAATPGLPAYARAQKNNEALDVVAEFNAVMSAIDGVTNWINTNFPKGAGGHLLAQTLGATGPTDRQFTSVELNTFRTVLDSLINTIA